MSPESRACLILIGAFTTISAMTFRGAPSPDLLASWVAGQMWAAGETGQIYPALDTVFPMLPPEGWPEHLAAQGYVGAVFPFVYPPIWAVLTGALTRLFSLAVFEDAATLLNPLALGGMCWLALRATGPGKLPRPVLLAVGLFLMLVTLPGAVALEQNQPQILVSLLIVAAIERDRAGAPRAAGIALAVAASIKLYPVLFTVIWLARRRWGAVASFALAGGMLGGASVALAGWPLHAEFLALVGSIRHTALVTSFTYGIDAGIAQIWFSDALRFVTGHGQTGDVTRGWTILEKPGAWVALSTAALVAVLGAAAAVAARRPGSLLLWPATVIAVALVSPLAWGYHYLPALAFAPLILDRAAGPARGGALLLALCLPMSLPAFGLLARVPLVDLFPQLSGTVALAAMALVFARAAWRGG